MFDLFLRVAIGLAALADPASGPRLLNLDELVTTDDYPAIAIDEDQQGTATVRLKINRHGFVESCRIVVSSGHPALDEQTCAVYRARARFEPGRNSAGQTVASEYEQRVVWRLAGDRPAPAPRQAWMTRGTVGITTERAVVDCKSEAVGLPSPLADCKALLALAETENFRAGNGASIAEYTIREIYFYPLPADKITPPPMTPGAKEQAQQISEIIIGSDGRVSGCKGVRYSGIATPIGDACPFVKNTRFTPAVGQGDLVGTVVMRVSARPNSGT